MSTKTPQLASQGGATLVQQFEYDQMNRITASAIVGGNLNVNAFKTNYAYDAGGNITDLSRSNIYGHEFDKLKYNYHNTVNSVVKYQKNTNKLRWVDDDVTYTDTLATDIDDQLSENYSYDDLGNLVKDLKEDIDTIEWTVYGRIKYVKRTGSSIKPNLEFTYDCMGNRVMKRAIFNSGSTKETYYVRDGNGLVMSLYETTNNQSVRLKEQYVYGVRRLGKVISFSDSSVHVTGLKEYEFTDHLGSVHVLLSDKLMGNIPLVLAAADYYPFGMSMPGRSYNADQYRYGYSGKEKDDELAEGDYDFGLRIYDSRLGRWLALDPAAYKMPCISPYAYALNSPLIIVDEEGKYPKPSELLSSIGLTPPPMVAGLIDGFVSGLGWIEAGEMVYKLATDPKFRSQMYDTFATIASDPVGFAAGIVDSYVDKAKEIASGSAKGQYAMGEIVGELIGGAVSGGAANKLIKMAGDFKASKLAKKAKLDAANTKKSNNVTTTNKSSSDPVKEKSGMPDYVKEGKDFEVSYLNNLVKQGKNVTTQVSFTAVDPKTGKSIRAIVDGVVKNADGSYSFIELKLNGTTKLTYNQSVVYKALAEGSATAVGQKALDAGFKVGQKVKAKVVVEVKYKNK